MAGLFCVLVCGGRDYQDRARVFAELDAIDRDRPITRLVHGAARGADTLAGAWADERMVPVYAHPADWSKGRGAGHARNAEMLKAQRPDLVVAFPGGRGTAGMVRLARAAGVRVVEISP